MKNDEKWDGELNHWTLDWLVQESLELKPWDHGATVEMALQFSLCHLPFNSQRDSFAAIIFSIIVLISTRKKKRKKDVTRALGT